MPNVKSSPGGIMLESATSGYCRPITCGLTRRSRKVLIIIAMILSISAAFAANSAQAATVETDKLDYAPGETVVVTGSGWQAAETVTLLFHEVPTLSADVTVYATADDAGNIVALYTIEPQDAGVTYTLTATGNSSGLTAQTVFTDKPSMKLSQCANGVNGTVLCNDAINAG